MPEIPESIIQEIINKSEHVRGFTRGEEAVELVRLAYGLDPCETVVEIGSFLGSSAILLAGARWLAGYGTVHCIDPFDGSGDAFSEPYYRESINGLKACGFDKPLINLFWDNLQKSGFADEVRTWVGRAEEVGTYWYKPIDLLYMDGDQSPQSTRTVWDLFSNYLKPGSVVALHNSEPGNDRETHDGHRLLVEQELRSPVFSDVRLIGTTTFAVKR